MHWSLGMHWSLVGVECLLLLVEQKQKINQIFTKLKVQSTALPSQPPCPLWLPAVCVPLISINIGLCVVHVWYYSVYRYLYVSIRPPAFALRFTQAELDVCFAPAAFS